MALQQTPRSLDQLGWTSEHDEWAEGIPHDDRGRIARASRGFCVVFTGGETVMAASGSVRSDLGIAPATGDFVTVTMVDDTPVISGIAPRTTDLTRRAPAGSPSPRPSPRTSTTCS